MIEETCACHEQSGPCEACSVAIALTKIPSWDLIVKAYKQYSACGKDAAAGERVRFLVAKTIAPLLVAGSEGTTKPVPMILHCLECSTRHIDAGEFATKPHHTHACQRCGFVWRPAIVHTVGVQFLPGFKDETKPLCSSICTCPAASEYDDLCPRHGIVGIGVTPR